MDHERFRDWFSHVDDLTAMPRAEVAAALSERPQGAASLAAIELGVDDERRCPHCGSGGAVSRGKARGLRRYRCKGLWEDIRCAHRHGAVGSAPQGALAVVRRVVDLRGDDTRVCRALRDCAEHGASLALQLPGGGSASAGPACRDRRGRRDLRAREPEGGAETGPQAAPTRRQGPAASRASRCRSWSPPIAPARPAATPCLPSTPTA